MSMQTQRLAGPPRDNMYVNMKYRLAALSAVELKDLNAIRFDGCHDSSCYLLDGQDEWHELVAFDLQ